MTTTKKTTTATVKSFIRKNISRLLIKVTSDFDGMIDCVTSTGDKRFVPVSKADTPIESNNMGLRGVWFTTSRNGVYPFETETHIGYEVSNCCGAWTVAVAK